MQIDWAAMREHELDPSEVNKELLSTIVKGLANPAKAVALLRQKRLERWHAEFEEDLDFKNWRKIADDRYEPENVQIMWEGYLLRCQKKEPSIFFGNTKITFSNNERLRMNEVDELSNVFACYITQLMGTWPKDHVRMQSVFKDIEHMCRTARAFLSEEDADNFCRALVDHSGRAKKR